MFYLCFKPNCLKSTLHRKREKLLEQHTGTIFPPVVMTTIGQQEIVVYNWPSHIITGNFYITCYNILER